MNLVHLERYCEDSVHQRADGLDRLPVYIAGEILLERSEFCLRSGNRPVVYNRSGSSFGFLGLFFLCCRAVNDLFIALEKASSHKGVMLTWNLLAHVGTSTLLGSIERVTRRSKSAVDIVSRGNEAISKP